MRNLLYGLATMMVAFAIGTAAMADTSNVNLCTGGEGGAYHTAGKMIASMAKGDPNVSVTVIETNGTWDNIQKTALGDQCDAMIGQPDGPALLKRQNASASNALRPVADLHREYLHALCSKDSGVDDIGDLESDPKGNGYSIALGNVGSGSWLIWQNFVAEDADYGEVPVTTEVGPIALSSVANNQTTCVLAPAAIPAPLVSEADVNYGDGLILAGVNDSDFNDAVDAQGKPLYEFMKIPSGTYANSLQAGWFSGAKTVSWTAKVYVNTERFDDRQKTLSSFITAVNRAKGSIQAKYGK